MSNSVEVKAISNNKDNKKKIPVVVVESHQHVLEHIHHVLRRQKLLNSTSAVPATTSTWSMLHFDSHADLACPSGVPAVACFQPRRAVLPLYSNNSNNDDDREQSQESDEKNLYELLDSTPSGIAEWILPCVLAANLGAVHWIRPQQQHPEAVQQIPIGVHNYNVGAWLPDSKRQEIRQHSIETFLDLPLNATVKVDWDKCSYYLEDDSCAPLHELMLPRPLHLIVSETPTSLQQRTQQDMLAALDVCLDYFACLNPFVTDIEELDAGFARTLVTAVVKSTFYTAEQRHIFSDTYQDDLTTFRRCLVNLLLSYCDETSDEISMATCSSTLIDSTAQLLTFYDTCELGLSIVEAVRISLLTPNSDNNKRHTLIQLAIEAVPNLTMPHNYAMREESSVQQRLQCFRACLREWHVDEPFIITIARSTNDGFTPKPIAEDLQVSVLEEIHTRYCGCKHMKLECLGETGVWNNSACRLHVIFDYGAWEGSTL